MQFYLFLTFCLNNIKKLFSTSSYSPKLSDSNLSGIFTNLLYILALLLLGTVITYMALILKHLSYIELLSV